MQNLMLSFFTQKGFIRKRLAFKGSPDHTSAAMRDMGEIYGKDKKVKIIFAFFQQR